MEELLLDPRIRNWVLLPIMIVTFLVQALRHYVTEYMKLSSAQSQQETDPRKIYEKYYYSHFYLLTRCNQAATATGQKTENKCQLHTFPGFPVSERSLLECRIGTSYC